MQAQNSVLPTAGDAECMYMFWQQTMSLVDPTSCDLCLMHCDSYTCLGLNIGYIQLANLWHSLPCWVQMIRHAYQLRDATPEDVGTPAQALQPLACGNHHYPLFKHFPPAAVKLQVGLLLLLPVQAACLWKLQCSLYLSPPSAALLSPHCARAAGGGALVGLTAQAARSLLQSSLGVV